MGCSVRFAGNSGHTKKRRIERRAGQDAPSAAEGKEKPTRLKAPHAPRSMRGLRLLVSQKFLYKIQFNGIGGLRSYISYPPFRRSSASFLGSFLCQAPGQKSLSHSSWSWPPPQPYLRETQARQQREICQLRRSIPAGRRNASKVVPQPSPRVTVQELFIAFAGPRGIPLTVPEFKDAKRDRDLPNPT
jgi:hypothetical protein